MISVLLYLIIAGLIIDLELFFKLVKWLVALIVEYWYAVALGLIIALLIKI